MFVLVKADGETAEPMTCPFLWVQILIPKKPPPQPQDFPMSQASDSFTSEEPVFPRTVAQRPKSRGTPF